LLFFTLYHNKKGWYVLASQAATQATNPFEKMTGKLASGQVLMLIGKLRVFNLRYTSKSQACRDFSGTFLVDPDAEGKDKWLTVKNTLWGTTDAEVLGSLLEEQNEQWGLFIMDSRKFVLDDYGVDKGYDPQLKNQSMMAHLFNAGTTAGTIGAALAQNKKPKEEPPAEEPASSEAPVPAPPQKRQAAPVFSNDYSDEF